MNWLRNYDHNRLYLQTRPDVTRVYIAGWVYNIIDENWSHEQAVLRPSVPLVSGRVIC